MWLNHAQHLKHVNHVRHQNPVSHLSRDHVVSFWNTFWITLGWLLGHFCFRFVSCGSSYARLVQGIVLGSVLGHFWERFGTTMGAPWNSASNFTLGGGEGSGPALCPLLPGFGLTFLMQALFVYQAHLNHCLAHCCNPAGLWQLTEWTRFVPTTAGFRPHIPHASTLCLPSPPKSLSCSLL